MEITGDALRRDAYPFCESVQALAERLGSAQRGEIADVRV